MTEEELRARIGELEVELDEKEHEIIGYFDKIEQLEDTILRLELLIPDEEEKSNKRKKKKGSDSKLAIQLQEKDIEIRELKDKMGFLRKEKVQLQQKLENLHKANSSTLIRIEEKKEPLDILVKELQSKINKQQLIIDKLKEDLKTNR